MAISPKLPVSVLGLGIETSCDETAIAIVRDGREILSQPLFSQIDLHNLYGGVIPELASRSHYDKIPFLLKLALSEAAIAPHDLDYIAVTVKPGLTGSLLVGYQTALAVQDITGRPLIPVHHLEAHILAVYLNANLPFFPFLGVLISGGNSAIYRVDDIGSISLIGNTMDDAAGEALDKAASLLNLPYPGGPQIEKLARSFLSKKDNKSTENPLPIPLRDLPRNEVRFSFSGLKTALLYLLEKQKNEYSAEHLAWAFQERVIESIDRNIKHAVDISGIRSVVVSGGVSANGMLREKLEQSAAKVGYTLFIPPKQFSTDNAAMVATAGYLYFAAKKFPVQNYVSSDNAFNFSLYRN